MKLFADGDHVLGSCVSINAENLLSAVLGTPLQLILVDGLYS